MAKTWIQTKQFNNDSGESVDYERLTISGYVNGEVYNLEVKLTPAELTIAKMLLASDENEPQANSRPATKTEQAEYNEKNNRGDDTPSWLND